MDAGTEVGMEVGMEVGTGADMGAGLGAGIQPLEGGHSGETFLASAGGEQTVVRIYAGRSRGRGPAAPEIDAAVLELVRGLVPVPQVLEVRPGNPATDTPGLLITSLMPGVRLETLLAGLSEDDLRRVGAELGTLLGRLSHMAMPQVGTFTDRSLRLEPFTAGLGEWLAQHLPEHERTIPGLAEAVEDAEDLLALTRRSCLVHSDFNPKNLLVDPTTLEVTAVLDWEFAHAGNPFSDLGNLLRFEESPVLTEAVLRAYAGFVPDAPEDLLARARAADLFALIELASRAGENPVADQALTRLRTLGSRRASGRGGQLDAGGPHAVP